MASLLAIVKICLPGQCLSKWILDMRLRVGNEILAQHQPTAFSLDSVILEEDAGGFYEDIEHDSSRLDMHTYIGFGSS
jgi:hypothetical protein